jgi:hypothetical protein
LIHPGEAGERGCSEADVLEKMPAMIDIAFTIDAESEVVGEHVIKSLVLSAQC